MGTHSTTEGVWKSGICLGTVAEFTRTKVTYFLIYVRGAGGPCTEGARHVSPNLAVGGCTVAI